jgi:uncharacterized RDD family membrane protein YckC
MYFCASANAGGNRVEGRWNMDGTRYADRWHYLDGEVATGPFTWQRLSDLFAGNLIGPDTLVWRDGEPDWFPMEEALRRAPPASKPPPLPVPPPGRSGSADPGAAPVPVRPAPAPSVIDADGWSSTPVAPWRRYAARMLDSTLYVVIGIFAIGYAWAAIDPRSLDALIELLDKPQGRMLDSLVTLLVSAVIGGVVIGATGSSIGKMLFGVKVVTPDFRPIGIGSGLLREIRVWLSGLGLGIPLISLLAMIISFDRLKKHGVIWWDEGRFVVLHRPSGTRQSWLNAFGILLMVVACGILVLVFLPE